MLYQVTRKLLSPIRLLLSFLQDKFVSKFPFMNMGATQSYEWKNLISNKLYDYKVLDFGCGIGNFAPCFKPDNYIGVDLNTNFLKIAKIKNPSYKFYDINFFFEKLSVEFNSILMNAIIHHLSQNDVDRIFNKLKTKVNGKKNIKVLIIEPLLPANILSFEFFIKALDVGSYIRSKESYIEILSKHINIISIDTQTFQYDRVVIINGFL